MPVGNSRSGPRDKARHSGPAAQGRRYGGPEVGFTPIKRGWSRRARVTPAFRLSVWMDLQGLALG